MPIAAATLFPSSIRSCSRRPRSPKPCSSANEGQWGSPVRALTLFTEALKISLDHWAGRASSSATALRPEATIMSAASFTTENGVAVGSNGPIHVAVSSSYCTRVSECRVPRQDLLATQAVLRGKNRAAIKQVADRSDGFLRLRGLGADDAELALRQIRGIRGGAQPGSEIMLAGDAEAQLVEGLGMRGPAHKGVDFRHPRQVGGIQT